MGNGSGVYRPLWHDVQRRGAAHSGHRASHRAWCAHRGHDENCRERAAWIIGPRILVGLSVAVLLARIAAQLLFGLKAYDPLTIAVVTLLLVSVSQVAIGFPARRASRLDPTLAIRSER